MPSRRVLGLPTLNSNDAPGVLLLIAGIVVVIFGLVITFQEQGSVFGGLVSIGTGAVIAAIGLATMGQGRRRR